jgi:hypothetical protein
MIGKRTLKAALLVGLIWTAPETRADDPAHYEAYANACSHYVNRAFFKPRDSQPEFVVTLADGCLAAQRSLAASAAQERVAAAAFLSRLVDLRDTIVDMNMERVFGKTYNKYTRIPSNKDERTESVPRVSTYGEYLIAHQMGLIAAYNAWLDTEPSIAMALPGAN